MLTGGRNTYLFANINIYLQYNIMWVVLTSLIQGPLRYQAQWVTSLHCIIHLLTKWKVRQVYVAGSHGRTHSVASTTPKHVTMLVTLVSVGIKIIFHDFMFCPINILVGFSLIGAILFIKRWEIWLRPKVKNIFTVPYYTSRNCKITQCLSSFDWLGHIKYQILYLQSLKLCSIELIWIQQPKAISLDSLQAQ